MNPHNAAFHAVNSLKLLPDSNNTLLIDVYRTLPEGEKLAFRRGASEFQNGLNATISGARDAMRQWIAKRGSWVTDAMHEQRIAFLATLDRFVEERA